MTTATITSLTAVTVAVKACLATRFAIYHGGLTATDIYLLLPDFGVKGVSYQAVITVLEWLWEDGIVDIIQPVGIADHHRKYVLC